MSALGSGAVSARPVADGAFLSLGRQTEAPRGFVEMCRSDETFCATPGHGAGDAALVTGAIVRRAAQRDTRVATATPSPVAPDASVVVPIRSAAATVVEPVVDVTLGTEPRSVAAGSFHAIAATVDVAATPVESLFAIAMRHEVRLALGRIAGLAEAAAPIASVEPTPAVVDAPGASAGIENVALLRQINRRVNGRVRQRSDAEVYGQAEHWQRSGIARGAQGDCEDLAIEKRYELVAAGIDPRRLSFAVVYQRSVGLHTVLLARTASGDVVLDSRTPYIHRWNETGYAWVSIQSPTSPMEWHALGSRRAEMAAVDQAGPVA